jgi:Cu(I)/Ag(I) efflux system membrane fusion protein
MKVKLIPVIVATFGLVSSPALLAQGCCGGGGAMKEGCSMGGTAAAGGHGGHEGHAGAPAATSQQNPSPKARLAQPVQAVFDNYIKLQGSLAQDSLEGVSSTATAMVKAIRGDSMKMLSQKVAAQAEALAQAKDLETARAAFKPLSESLIQYLKDQKVPSGTYHEAYCPMAKASWLQTDTTIINPYMGKSMVHCGQIKT